MFRHHAQNAMLYNIFTYIFKEISKIFQRNINIKIPHYFDKNVSKFESKSYKYSLHCIF